MTQDTKKLRSLFTKTDSKSSQSYDKLLDSMIDKYDLTPKDVRTMEKQFSKEEDFDTQIYMFSHLPWEAQKPILDSMTEDEREEYLKHVSRDKREKYEKHLETVQ
jgi:hypothetical protein